MGVCGHLCFCIFSLQENYKIFGGSMKFLTKLRNLPTGLYLSIGYLLSLFGVLVFVWPEIGMVTGFVMGLVVLLVGLIESVAYLITYFSK